MSKLEAPRSTRTVLRIKRKRTEEPLPYLRLEGLQTTSVQDVSLLLSKADFDHPQQSEKLDPVTSPRKSVLWRRREEENLNKKRSYRIVDALLEQAPDDGDGADGNSDSRNKGPKRRKLTVIESKEGDLLPETAASSPSKQRTPFKVLDPLSRMVDDSLQEVHAGEKSPWAHYRFVMDNVNLAVDTNKWLAWSHSSGGNLLHACALWNDVETASNLCRHHPNLVDALTSCLNVDQQTPYEAAELSGHDSVCQVLEAFGADTSNYVYDIYDLDDSVNQLVPSTPPDDALMTVELKGGVGYWTPDGELVLEAPEKTQESLDHIFDGEIDSNCEEHGANDYPDEDWVDSDEEEEYPGFRHDPIAFDEVGSLSGFVDPDML